MEEELLERRAQLENEIEIASHLLVKNFDEAKIGDYIGIGSSAVPALLDNIIDNPSTAIARADMIARNTLANENPIRKIIKYFSLFSRGINLLIQK